MSASRGTRRWLALIGVIGLLMAGFAAPVAGSGAPSAAGGTDLTAESAKSPSSYIVRMADPPVASYEGGRPGYAATSPRGGEKINPNAAHVRRYSRFLDERHASALAAAGARQDAKFYDYRFSFNGFAAVLTPAQVARLRAMPEVVSVQADVLRQPQTDTSPDFLGLSGEGGLWEQSGGVGAAGEDVIVGVVDTGIWPEHPSFSDQADLADRPGNSGKRSRVYDAPPSDWHGTCQAGEQWSKDDCNNKLIGARYFLSGFGHFGVIAEDYLSARDADGHGTHTASTAAGNAGVDPSIFGSDLGVDTVSGMAPRARVAMYKACWNDEGCAGTDLVAAIDAAVADGVDVINYSIGSDTPALFTADGLSFLFADDAGVYVATSAGNAGPGAATVGSPASAAWVTAVGASTHSRTFEGAVTLGDGSTFAGASVTAGTDVLPLVDAEDAPAAGVDPAEAAECLPGTLDPAAVAGKIVLCIRGTIARVTKSEVVADAGGAGMVLYNASPNEDVVTDNHFVPSVHVAFADGDAIKSYIATAGATATAQIEGGTAVADPGAPDMASFSSRGPNGASGDLLKPDVTAPGVNILAGNTPNPLLSAPGQLFQSISGTSMSSPHVAGVGALLTQLHPDWSPAMVRSALMTTAHQDVDKEDGTTPADPFDFGAGHIAPLPAADPGLVYDSGFDDYLDFLCGSGEGCFLGAQPVDPSDLNLASIAIGELAGFQTITRTVTNTGAAGTYEASVEAPPGVDVIVNPSTLELDAGEIATYEVTFTTLDGAALDEWTFGSLTWADDAGHAVRSPIAVRPVALAAPDEITGAGGSGETTYDVTFGYTGDFSTAVHGLVPATTQVDTVVDDPANDINVALDTGVGINVHPFTVDPGTRHLRLSLFDELTDGEDDIDLYLFDCTDPDAGCINVDVSGTGTSAEQVDVADPAAGDWLIVVHGWQTDGANATYTLFRWNLGDAAAGNLTATGPTSATLGDSASVTVGWNGLTAGTRYLGSVSYSDGIEEIDRTLVSVTG